MSDPSVTSAPPIERARALFAGEGLPFPPLPAMEAARLAAADDAVFATRALPARPYDIGVYRSEIARGETPEDYVVLGFDGYGANSWGAHYYRVEPGLALFFQLYWGGAYADPEAERPVVERAFALAEKLQKRIAEARAAGLLPEGWRLLAVASAFGETGWAWVPPTASPAAPVALTPARPLGAALDAVLDDLFAGRVTFA